MSAEGSIRNQRIETVREANKGAFPVDPSLMFYSDNVVNFEWSPSPGVEERRGVGGPDVDEFHNGPEEHEVTVEYDLQRFPVDTNGNPDDPSGDGVIRDGNNDLPNTHSLLVREENLAVPASETVNGSKSLDTRLFVVGLGGRIEGVTFSGDPSSQQPVTVELTYVFEKVREYQIDQPDAAIELGVVNNGTASVDVTIEDEGAATSETVTVAAGATANTTATFGNVDAVNLSTDIDGDVELHTYDTTNAVTVDHLATIRGENFYGHGEGDTGVPALGAGTHATALGTAYETILGDTFERPVGAPLAFEVNSVEFTVENEVDTREQAESPRMAMSVGNRTVEVGSTVVGPTESVKNAEQALGNVPGTFMWSLTGGDLKAIDSRLTDFPGVAKTEGEAAMSLDNTFTGETVELSAN